MHLETGPIVQTSLALHPTLTLPDLLRLYPGLWYLTAGLLGLMVGSFLNVVVYRLPLMMQRDWRGQCRELLELEPEPAEQTPAEPFNLMVPRSRCPHCGHWISALENIPVLSWLWLRGRCSECRRPISIRYPLVEVATALLSGIVAWRLGFGWAGGAALLFTWAMVALTLIDYDHQLLPDDIVLPGLWLGLLLSLVPLFTDPRSAVIGAAAGYLSLWTVFQAFRLLTGKEGMGFGDFKLFALFGAWMGWEHLLQIILLSSAVGAVVGGSLVMFMGHDRARPIPFGPYLAAAGWISLLWGDQINLAYLRWAGLA